MRQSLLATICLVPLLGGCGKASEDTFNKQYDESFMASCVSAASRGNVTSELATKMCDCALDGINAKFSATEKVALSQEQAAPIVNACKEKVMPGHG